MLTISERLLGCLRIWLLLIEVWLLVLWLLRHLLVGEMANSMIGQFTVFSRFYWRILLVISLVIVFDLFWRRSHEFILRCF